ncbi:hypothetical protein JFV29_03150 [Peribacillus sp. TH16]|uniref:hypothetical protein n=1 Tax=Peribacillus sp. TH16 TaxID=2798482 RepID=UPI0019122185|nr:hypothetical protein [Peribacillus sp. TH16]MBK5480936.1 hypothetical protein [Peribacillus sp. TH16]
MQLKNIIQAIASTQDDGKAKKARMYAGFLVITIGIIAALIGMNASIVFQNISLTEETLLSLGQLQFQQFGRQSHF